MIWIPFQKTITDKIAEILTSKLVNISEKNLFIDLSFSIAIIFFGFYPVPLMETLNVSVDNLINNYETAVQIESLN